MTKKLAQAAEPIHGEKKAIEHRYLFHVYHFKISEIADGVQGCAATTVCLYEGGGRTADLRVMHSRLRRFHRVTDSCPIAASNFR